MVLEIIHTSARSATDSLDGLDQSTVGPLFALSLGFALAVTPTCLHCAFQDM